MLLRSCPARSSMEWQEEALEGEEAEGLKGAFTTIREAPPRPAGRGQAAPAAEATRALRLAAWPALFKGEPEEQRLARADAADTCWQELAGNMRVRAWRMLLGWCWPALSSAARQSGVVCESKRCAFWAAGWEPWPAQCTPFGCQVAPPTGQHPARLTSTPPPPHPTPPTRQATLEATDAGVFQSLLEFAQRSHRPLAAGGSTGAAAGFQRVPTGLVLAGGVNSADHMCTFPNLAAFLHRAGCYVALLQPASFARGPGEAFGEVLRQMSGLGESRAEHHAALAAWYADEAGGAEPQQQPAPAAAPQQQQQQQAQDGAGAAEGGGKAEGRALRQRPAPAAEAAEAAAAAERAANRRRPLVVVVEGTESVDVLCLRDFLLVASEVRAVLGS